MFGLAICWLLPLLAAGCSPAEPGCEEQCRRSCRTQGRTYAAGYCIQNNGECGCLNEPATTTEEPLLLRFEEDSATTTTPWPGYPDCDPVCAAICAKRGDKYTNGNCDAEGSGHCRCIQPDGHQIPPVLIREEAEDSEDLEAEFATTAGSEFTTTPGIPTTTIPACEPNCRNLCAQLQYTYDECNNRTCFCGTKTGLSQRLSMESNGDSETTLTARRRRTPWPGYPNCEHACSQACWEQGYYYDFGNCSPRFGGRCNCSRRVDGQSDVAAFVALSDAHRSQPDEEPTTPLRIVANELEAVGTTPFPGYPDCDKICQQICTNRGDNYTLGNCDIENSGHCKCTLPNGGQRLEFLQLDSGFTTPDGEED